MPAAERSAFTPRCAHDARSAQWVVLLDGRSAGEFATEVGDDPPEDHRLQTRLITPWDEDPWEEEQWR